MIEGQSQQETSPLLRVGRLNIRTDKQDSITRAISKPETQQALERAFLSNNTEERSVISSEHLHFNQENVGNILIFSGNDKRVYVSNDEVVYSSEQNSKSKFESLAGFLSSPTGKKVEFASGPVADVALFGTINSNLPGVEAEDWMKIVAEAVQQGGFTAFNPNKGVGVQSSGIDMGQFAQESQHLFESPVVVMNFEPQRGGLALAELRIAMLASVLTGHKLIVRMEQPHKSEQVMRSRAVAMEDIQFFQEHIPELKDNMVFYDNDEITLSELAAEATKSAEEMKRKSPVGKKLSGPKQTHGGRVVLSGSSANAQDIAMRLELKHQMKEQRGIDVVDTYIHVFDEKTEEDNQLAAMRQSRKEELEIMDSATDHIVYAGGSLSPFGQLTTALLFSVSNGSRLRGLVLNPNLTTDIRDGYSTATYRSHLSKAVMNYQLAKIMNLLQGFEGVAPELQEYIPIIADAIDPIVASFEKTIITSANAFEDITLEKISPDERLIPQKYDPDIAAAVIRASGVPYPGYPEQEKRIHMTEDAYESWVAHGRPAATLFENYPTAYSGDHPNRTTSKAAREAREKGKMQDYDGTQTFPEGMFGILATDAHGAPLHPYAKEMLLAGVAVTGPGFYWNLGENPAADPMVLRIANGRLQTLIITRKDSKTAKNHDALPGGMGDPGDAGLSQTLERELHEEIGMDQEMVRAFPRIENVYSGVVADSRATLHAYPTTRLDVLLPTQEQLEQIGDLNVGDQEQIQEIISIHWMTLTQNNIQKLFGMHPELVMMGIQAWQEQTGKVIDKQGKVGLPE